MSTKRGFTKIIQLVLRWLLILGISLVIALPIVIISVEVTGMPTPEGGKDLGYGFVAFAEFVFTATASFLVSWPVAIWISIKLVSRFQHQDTSKGVSHE